MENLDLECAELGQKLGQGANKERKTLLMNALGVLQDQGLYAFFLFLGASSRGRPGEVCDACADFLRARRLLDSGNDLFHGLRSLAGRLDDLLLARELLLQALVYAQHHAKASGEEAGGGS
ncbi:hypothetical protein HRbin33_00856 [bacterium HR33]|nr:hypothetical protein HRbin33_00856 [bacterium HR33]